MSGKLLLDDLLMINHDSGVGIGSSMANEDSSSSVSAVNNSALLGAASSAENSMVDGEQVYHVFRDFNQVRSSLDILYLQSYSFMVTKQRSQNLREMLMSVN